MAASGIRREEFGKLFCMGINKAGMAMFFDCTEADIDAWCLNNIGEDFADLCSEVEYAKHVNQDKERPYTVYMHIAPSGKKYIGVTKCTLNKRADRGRGYHDNDYFANAIKKYGWENFRHAILFMRLTREEAAQKEIEMIKRFRTTDRRFGYNIEGGGNLKKEVSQETREKLRKASTGKYPSAETRRKMSESHSGEKCRFYGVPNSEEQKRHLRELRSKPVLQLDDQGNVVKRYASMKEAAAAFGVTRQAISSSARGKSKKAVGFYWKFAGTN